MMRSPLLVSAAVLALGAGTAVHASDSDQQVNADPRGIVEVSNFSGRVDVTVWDQPRVSVHANTSDGTNNVDVRGDHGRTTITVRMHGGMSWGGVGNADLDIKIPKTSELDVTSVSADVNSKGVLGVQRLKTVSGSIRADISSSDVEAKTVSGNVFLRGDGKPASIHMTSISGGIRLEHGAGDLEATTVSGDLEVQLEPGRSVRVRT